MPIASTRVHNAKSIRCFTVLCPAINTAYQLPFCEIPDGMFVSIKSHPANAIAGLVYVSDTNANARNPNQAWPLVLNEAINFQIKNTQELWISVTVPGDSIVVSVERD